jgi:ferritin
MSPVHDLLNTQIGHEFAASQQYVAIAVWYDQQALPQLSGFFYAQAVEERNHAMMIVQYLMDRGADVVIPGIPAVRNDFASVAEPIELALSQEVQVTGQFETLTALARDERDYLGEQFMHWFLKEQVEEVSSMSTLLQVANRVGENVMLLEDYLAREAGSGEGVDPTAPAAAGGKL